MKKTSFGRWIEVREGGDLPQIVNDTLNALRECIRSSWWMDAYRRDGGCQTRLRGRNGRSQDHWEAHATYSPSGTILTLKFRPWTSSRWQQLITTSPASATPTRSVALTGSH
ncbi:MAG: hypothetical protein AAB733_03540 [Patescibacteria group bacterium]